MPSFSRRDFLKTSGLFTIPGIFGTVPAFAGIHPQKGYTPGGPFTRFFSDGEIFDGPAYWEELQKFNDKHPVRPDRYGSGGAVEELEKEFEKITGKEKAIYMPTGTMANQLAIAVLSGDKTKVFVQDTSHVYRDEADAAQSIFNKRLMPLAKNETYFTAAQLKDAIAGLDNEEVFKSGIGAVSIENPVRRADGRMVPITEIKSISRFCRDNNIQLHLDGARIFLASAWSGIPVAEYASYFDTVYISLYKYFGASAGAVLCGESNVINKMSHLIKIHGGNQFGNWLNAAMAYHRLQGFNDRMIQTVKLSKEIFNGLNQLQALKISALDGGTNIYHLQLSGEVNTVKFTDVLATKYSIRMPRPNGQGFAKIFVNETLLYRDKTYFVNAFADAIKQASS